MPYKDKEKQKEYYSNYYKNKRLLDTAYKEANLKQSAEWWQKNKDIAKIRHRNNKLQRIYNISVEEYDRILNDQNHVCAICKQSEKSIDSRTKEVKRLVVDHCHKTNKVRGLLCYACNVTLGKVEEREDILLSMITYLKQHNESHSPRR